MRLAPHVGLSGAIGGGLWAATGEPLTLPAALAAGVLPDGDHLIDYYNWYVRRSWRRLILALHGWEYLLALTLLYLFVIREDWMLAVVLGYASQIGTDQLFNRVYWHTYLITGRALNGFRIERVSQVDVSTTYEALVGSVPFGRAWLRRWFESRVHGGQ